MPGLFDDLISPAPTRRVRAARQIQRPDFRKPDGWTPHSDLPELSGIVALDTENKDPGLGEGFGSSWPHPGIGFNCGYSISSPQGDFYLPIRHSEGNTDPDRVHRWLKAQAAKPDVVFVYANCTYDLGWLWRDGIEPANAPIDVSGMAALLDEFKFSYSLDALGNEYLGEGKNDEAFIQACAQAGLIDPKSNMDLLPGWIAEPYAVQDAKLTRALYHALAPKLAAEGLDGIHALERECYIVGYDMKKRGVRVDTDKAVQRMEFFEQKRNTALQAVYDATGVRCSASDNVALARALRAENPRIDLPQTTQGRDSIRKDYIEGINSPVADLINAARRYDKAINTFFRGYLLESSVGNRIHADFNPLRRNDDDGGMKGTVSGRWSCSSPNLQNLSARDPEIGVAVRGCFLPDEGCEWAKFDYASQEPRLTVHYAELCRLPGAVEMGNRFRQNAMTDLHAETAALMGVPRQQAKVINLSLAYGAGGAKLCKQLGLPTRTIVRQGRSIEVAGEEGERLLKKHMQGVPFLRQLQKMTEARGKERGYVTTILGRRCRFPRGEFDRTYAALNRVIQGSAGDMCKKAMVDLRRAGIPMQITVHDEIDTSVPIGDESTAAQIKNIMEEAIPLSIPVVVDVKVAADWGACLG